jgi:hypothetical protein
VPLETYTTNHTLYANHLEIRRDFARGMRKAQVCVFDASLERKMIRKVGTSACDCSKIVVESAERNPMLMLILFARSSLKLC